MICTACMSFKENRSERVTMLLNPFGRQQRILGWDLLIQQLNNDVVLSFCSKFIVLFLCTAYCSVLWIVQLGTALSIYRCSKFADENVGAATSDVEHGSYAARVVATKLSFDRDCWILGVHAPDRRAICTDICVHGGVSFCFFRCNY